VPGQRGDRAHIARLRPGVDALIGRVHAEDRPRVAAVASSLRSDPVPDDPVAVEYRAVWPNGAIRDMRALGRVERKDGVPVRVVGFVQDVTAERLTERELRARYGAMAVAGWQGHEAKAAALIETIMSNVEPRGEGMGLSLASYTGAVLRNGLGHHDSALALGTAGDRVPGGARVLELGARRADRGGQPERRRHPRRGSSGGSRKRRTPAAHNGVWASRRAVERC
jgi:PAS fold